MTTETKFIAGIGIVTVVIAITGVMILGKEKPKPASTVDKAVVIADARYTKGNKDAKAQIVEFGDFQCPACAAAEPILRQVVEKNKDKVYFVFKNFPLSSHPNSRPAHQAAEAAGMQGKYWEMHDKLYDTQSQWQASSNPQDVFEGFAKELGLDIQKYKDDLGKTTEFINKEAALGDQLGVNSTPTFFLNGEKKPGVLQEADLQKFIDSANTSQ